MSIKYLYIVLIVAVAFIASSCQNDAKEEIEESIVIVDSSLIDNSEIDNNTEIKEKKVVEKKPSIKDAPVIYQKEETIIEVEPEEDKDVLDLREETSKDLEKEDNKKVNIVVNPDNDNSAFEIKEDATITVVPILSAQDKAKYYVQFTIKISKISKADLATYFPESQKIYVVQHLGLYKYCVGQFDKEEEAVAYKTIADKEFNFKKSEVATYSDAW